MMSLRATAGMKAPHSYHVSRSLLQMVFLFEKRTVFQARAEAKQNLVGSKSKARQMGSKQGRGHCCPSQVPPKCRGYAKAASSSDTTLRVL